MYGFHGVPFDAVERVGDFMARVKNVAPNAEVEFVPSARGGEYVLIKVPDLPILVVEEGDELKTNEDQIWVKRKED